MTRKIHESEYASNDYWKYNLDEPEYKRGSRHNKIGMWIMWTYYIISAVFCYFYAFWLVDTYFQPVWAGYLSLSGTRKCVFVFQATILPPSEFSFFVYVLRLVCHVWRS